MVGSIPPSGPQTPEAKSCYASILAQEYNSKYLVERYLQA